VKKNILLNILFIISTISPSTAQIFTLSGNDWKIKDAPGDSTVAFCSDWIPAKVPGNIQADLENARVLNPLWYGAGDARLYDVPKNEWCYRKEFKVPAGFLGKRIRLVFDGVDYACEVWLNGKKIGSNPNMFRRFEFDVADVLKIGETNQLDVRIARIPSIAELYIEKSDGKYKGGKDWYFHAVILKTLETLKDLKSPMNFGYDFGVNIWTLGIWKDVRLEASDVVAIEYFKIETPLSDNYRKAKVQVNVVVNSLAGAKGILKLKITGNGIERTTATPFSITEGSNKLYGEIALDNPALWWPNGHGKQNLYNLEATLVDASGKILHSLHTRFGVREVRWELTSEAPADFPQKYMPVVNGRAIRMIGSNLLPPDLLFARIPERAPHLLRVAKASGFTTLRIWGGGVIFTPEVYSLADELGIMLSLEIPIANSDPKLDFVLLKNLDTTLRNIIHQVWNHPSIIEYTGGNEMLYGLGGDSTVIKHIRKIFAEEEPGRVFRDTDPIVGGRHGPWVYHSDAANNVDPNGVYSCWNKVTPRVLDKNGLAPKSQAGAMRHGEFGYQTPAHFEVWQREIPPSAQWPIDRENPILIRKKVTYAWATTFYCNVWLEKPLIEFFFGKSPNLEFLLKAGQYVGAEGLRYSFDALRRRGSATGGITTWSLNEPWPNGAGGYQVDYDGRPLMKNIFLMQAVAPLSLSLKHTSSLYNVHDVIKTELFLSGDADMPVSDLHWSWKARDRRGAVISSGMGSVKIDQIEIKKLSDISIKLPEKTAFGPVLLELQLSDSKGKVLNERVHIFGLAGVHSPLRGLLDDNALDLDDDKKMLAQLLNTTNKTNVKGNQYPEIFRPIKRTTLQLEASESRMEGEEEVLELKLRNIGKMTALFCEPKPVLNYRTDMIMDNHYVSIPPNESRTIRIRAPRYPVGGLSLTQTGWRIESWNANSLMIAPSSDILLALGREDRMCREFAGYPGLVPDNSQTIIRVKGRQVDAAKVPYLLDDSKTLELEFEGAPTSPGSGAVLRIHSSDQSTIGAMILLELNGKSFEVQLPEGYGFQKTEPARLAQAKTVEVKIPAEVVKKQGDNLLRIKVIGGGWFTLDALDLKSISTTK